MSKEVEFKNRDRFIQLGLTIAALRKMQGMSQEQLAEKLSLSTRYISQLERGIAFGSASTIISVCKALDINANFLFSDIINVTDSPSVNDLVGQNFIENYLKLDDYNKLIVNALTNELVKIQKSTKAKKEA